MADIRAKEAKGKDTKIKGELDHVRAAAQELHAAITDAAAKRGADMKAGLAAIPQKAKAVTEALKGSMNAQNEATRKNLAEAVKFLEATQKHVGESLKSSGQAFQTSVRQAIADTRASVQKISEAVAATRLAQSTHSHSPSHKR